MAVLPKTVEAGRAGCGPIASFLPISYQTDITVLYRKKLQAIYLRLNQCSKTAKIKLNYYYKHKTYALGYTFTAGT